MKEGSGEGTPAALLVPQQDGPGWESKAERGRRGSVSFVSFFYSKAMLKSLGNIFKL